MSRAFRHCKLQNASVLFGLIAFCAAATAQAETAVGSVRVTILDSLTIEETAVVDFGAIPGADGVCGMTETGALSGTKCEGSGRLGQFSISGTSGQSVHISVSAGSAGNGLSFEPQLVSGNTATLTDGIAIARIGGQLNLAGAAVGNQALTYYLTVNYN